MKTKKNFSPIVSHYKSFFADTFFEIYFNKQKYRELILSQ